MMNGSSTSAGQSCPIKLVQHFVQVYPVEQWKTEGFFQDEHLLDIDCHWMTFEPTRPSVHFLLAVIYVIVFLIGFLSNTLAIYIIVSSRKLLTPANILLVNLAISDLVIILTIPVFIFNSLNQGPAIGKLGCSVYGFVTGLSGTCSIMTLAAIAVERYLVISRSLKLDGRPTRRWAYSMSLLTWIYSFVFASLPFFRVGKYVPEGYLTGCSFDYLSNDLTTKIFILVFFIGAWVAPLSIIMYSYSSIIQIVAQVRRDVLVHHIVTNSIAPALSVAAAEAAAVIMVLDPNKNNSSSALINIPAEGIRHPINQQLNIEFKVAKILMGLASAWILTWTPYAVVALMGISGYGHLLTPSGAMIPSLFAKLATCVDPFIYVLVQPKIRQEIAHRLQESARRGDS